MSTILWAKSLLTDNLIHINDFKKNENQTVICIGCGSRLIAKQGTKNQWHFSHYNLSSCDGGFETALHLLAKEVFLTFKTLVLPPKIIFHKENNLTETATIVKSLQKIEIDECFIEMQLENIRPDILVVAKGHKLIIEIAVTHFIDDTKRHNIEKLGISCIEIDLSHLKNTYFDFETLKYELCNPKNAKWIFNRKEKEKLEILKSKIKEKEITRACP